MPKQRFDITQHEEVSRRVREIGYEMTDLILEIDRSYPKNVSRRIYLAREYFHKFQAAMNRELRKELRTLDVSLYTDRHTTGGGEYYYDPDTGDQIHLDSTDSRQLTDGIGSCVPETEYKGDILCS